MTDTLLEDLRTRFRQTARIRLDEMASLLDQLDEEPSERAPLERLARHFHGLAGMGGTYGFPAISALGDEAEDLIVPLVDGGGAPDAAMRNRWRTMVRDMEASLAND
jgi:chemotaxis protein histidine kinase CheA